MSQRLQLPLPSRSVAAAAAATPTRPRPRPRPRRARAGADLTLETLRQQYKLVRERASANHTYVQGSHVMRYGAVEMGGEVAADYLGPHHAPAPSARASASASGWLAGVAAAVRRVRVAVGGWLLQGAAPASAGAGNGGGHERARARLGRVAQRDADLLPLLHRAKHARCAKARAAAQAELQAAVAGRQLLDASVRRAVHKLLAHPQHGATLLASKHVQPHLVFRAAGGRGSAAHGGCSRCASPTPLPRAGRRA
jgi:hypothetical protein